MVIITEQSQKVTKCMFCNGVIPALLDSVYTKHMNDHHRAFVNIDVLFYISLMDSDDIAKLKETNNFEVGRRSLKEERIEDENENVFKEQESDIVEDENVFKEQESDILEISINKSISIVKEDGKDTKYDNTEVCETEVFHEAKKSNVKTKLESKNKIKKKAWTPMKCECDIDFKSRTAKIRHFRIVHKKYHACQECHSLRTVFKKEVDFLKHLQTNHLNKNRSNVCDDCGLVFDHWYKVNAHKARVHDSDKYQCSFCSTEIRGKYNLRRHERSHTEDKNKVCPECHKTVRYLKLHLKTMHLSNELKPHKCTNCDKGFSSYKGLKEHLLIHSEVRAFRCRFCNFASKTPGNRTKHELQRHKDRKLDESE